jgi:hypothetical protein
MTAELPDEVRTFAGDFYPAVIADCVLDVRLT